MANSLRYARLLALLVLAIPALVHASIHTNKAQVLALYDMLNKGDYSNLDQVVARDYQTHLPDHKGMPTLAQGLEGLQATLSATGAVPNEVKRVITDGDLVMVQVKYPGAKVVSGVDIFQFDTSGKIRQHWPVRQAVAADVTNPDIIYEGGGNTAKPMTAEQLERNRTIIRDTFEKVWQQGMAELTLDYYALDYKQHNPHIADGGERIQQIVATHVKDYMAAHGGRYPIDILHIGAQGDLVFIHCNITMVGLGRNEGVKTTSVDIMRINDEGKLAEHWDSLQMESDRLPDFSTLF